MSAAGKLADKIATLNKVPNIVADKVREKIQALIEAEFRNGNDPYGRAWKPLKAGGPSKLGGTGGSIASSLRVEVSGTQVKISFSDYKFAFHQKTRPMLTAGVMPESWHKAIEEAFKEALDAGH